MRKADKNRKEKVSRERRREQPKVRWTLGKVWQMAVSPLLLIGQSWVGANAASEKPMSQ